jgi:hypothetical protein
MYKKIYEQLLFDYLVFEDYMYISKYDLSNVNLNEEIMISKNTSIILGLLKINIGHKLVKNSAIASWGFFVKVGDIIRNVDVIENMHEELIAPCFEYVEMMEDATECQIEDYEDKLDDVIVEFMSKYYKKIDSKENNYELNFFANE